MKDKLKQRNRGNQDNTLRAYHFHKSITRIKFPKFDGQDVDRCKYTIDKYFGMDNTSKNHSKIGQIIFNM